MQGSGFFLTCVLIFVLVRNSEELKQAQKPHPFLNQVKECVHQWSTELSKELLKLSSTMTRKEEIKKNFSTLKDKISTKSEEHIVRIIADKLKQNLEKKKEAVQRIAEYAEFLAYHRKNDSIDFEQFLFYNADQIKNTTCDNNRESLLEQEIQEAKCEWWCEQKDLPAKNPLKFNSYDTQKIKELYEPACDCTRTIPRNRKGDCFQSLPLKEHYNFEDTKVNLNLSVVKIATNVFEGEQEVLQGVRWTEPLDMIFRENWSKDPTLKYQYFASPYGYMRHFPAVKWSDERYAQTYDPRTRSWYTEAMTSPKDVIILLDSSGSVCKLRRRIAALIVNNILDTLNDNDFVNIYLFSNHTKPLVDCFSDRLVQANEENLRLLRETLDNYKPEFQAEIEVGLAKAFTLLAEFRKQKVGSWCNQAIMLITEEAFFRGNERDFFREHNWKHKTPVRVFTYQLGRGESDARLLEWIACSNKGYFANISLMQEVREKALPYIEVMSRSLNYANMEKPKRGEFIWSYVYIDLADRRYTNWLWRKREGNNQRAVFLDHGKREFMRLQKVLSSESHFLLQDSHEYEKYETDIKDDYMTTLSLPVYSRKPGDVGLIGVAAVDIPLKLLSSLIPHHTIGVNGYAFIVTNNGYILMHPGHKREFENIPKPTFNRVDFLEVEMDDEENEPREFSHSIKRLRERILNESSGRDVLSVKYALDDGKRIVQTTRKYAFVDLTEAFTVGVALPDKYGSMVVDLKNVQTHTRGLLQTTNWTVHPEWVYCEDTDGLKPEEAVLTCIREGRTNTPLLKSLLFDAEATKWYEDPVKDKDYKAFIQKYLVDNVFMATHSGLTRWRTFTPQVYEEAADDDEGKAKKEVFRENRAIDEDWYKRVVEYTFHRSEEIYIYSVPYEISGYEYDTMITSTNAIFIKAEGKDFPVAAVGVQFNHRQMNQLYKTITTKCDSDSGLPIHDCSCESALVSCFILDDNAYVVLGHETEYTGRFIGDISPIITHRLINKGVYKRTVMYDYQATCQKPPEVISSSSERRSVTFFRMLLENLLTVTDWALATILMLISSVTSGPEYESTKNDTLLYERLEINKTVPTPCDQQMWLFTLGEHFSSVEYSNKSSKAGCDWYYVVERIPHSNLLFMAANPVCELDTVNHFQSHTMTPTPVEIDYNDSLACHIATFNDFPRKFYTQCYNNLTFEDDLNKNRTYCGHTWNP